MSDDRLVGDPSFEVVGQCSGRGVAGFGPKGHCLEANGFERRVEGRIGVQDGVRVMYNPCYELRA